MEVGEIWDKINYPEKLRKHCLTVNAKALEIADNLISDGITVDRELVNKGSLLHDIGRGVKHNIQHGIVSYDFPSGYGTYGIDTWTRAYLRNRHSYLDGDRLYTEFNEYHFIER